MALGDFIYREKRAICCSVERCYRFHWTILESLLPRFKPQIKGFSLLLGVEYSIKKSLSIRALCAIRYRFDARRLLYDAMSLMLHACYMVLCIRCYPMLSRVIDLLDNFCYMIRQLRNASFEAEQF